jgi:hypothetical protein
MEGLHPELINTSSFFPPPYAAPLGIEALIQMIYQVH